jgi:type I restriction enzyme S subunit
MIDVAFPKRASPWKRVKIGDICESKTGVYDPRVRMDEEFRYIDISAVDNVTKRIVETKSIRGRDAPSRARKLVRAGDVLVATTRPNLNAVAQIPVALDGAVCSTGFCVLRSTSLVDADFLFLAVRTQEFVDNLSSLVVGALYPAVSDADVLSQEIELPPKADQQCIAQAVKCKLAAVERARKASLARIDAARALSAAYLREIFDSEEAAEWTAFKLGDLALLVQNGLYKKDEFYGLGEPLIRMYNLDNESWRINQTKLARVTLEDDDKEKFRLKVGDLLVSRVNSYEQVGKSGIVSDKEDGAFFENMLIRLRFSSEVEPLFMANQFATQTFRKALRGLAKRAIGQASINSTDLRSQIVRLPGISRQREICRMLSMRQSSIEFLRNSLTEEHSALDAMPAAFLRRAFSGNL